MAMAEIGRCAGDYGMTEISAVDSVGAPSAPSMHGLDQDIAEIEQLLTISRRPVIAHRLSVFLAELQQVSPAVPAETGLPYFLSRRCLTDAGGNCGTALLLDLWHGGTGTPAQLAVGSCSAVGHFRHPERAHKRLLVWCPAWHKKSRNISSFIRKALQLNLAQAQELWRIGVPWLAPCWSTPAVPDAPGSGQLVCKPVKGTPG